MARRKGRATTEVIGVAPVNFPTGCVLPYAGTTAPEGWLLCDGSAVSRTDYAALFAVVSTAHGIGDGATTFNVPDYRYQVPRGRGGVANQAILPAAVNITTEEITVTGHQYRRTGFRVRVSSTGTIIGGLAVNTDYYVIVVNANTIKLATTRANAIAGTAINLTSQGTGTHTISQSEGPDFSSRTAVNGGNAGDNVGSLEEDVIQGHWHDIYDNRGSSFRITRPAGGVIAFEGPTAARAPDQGNFMFAKDLLSNGNNGTSRTGSETRSANILTNYIIKV
jgi:microcystin-dependent protein